MFAKTNDIRYYCQVILSLFHNTLAQSHIIHTSLLHRRGYRRFGISGDESTLLFADEEDDL